LSVANGQTRGGWRADGLEARDTVPPWRENLRYAPALPRQESQYPLRISNQKHKSNYDLGLDLSGRNDCHPRLGAGLASVAGTQPRRKIKRIHHAFRMAQRTDPCGGFEEMKRL